MIKILPSFLKCPCYFDLNLYLRPLLIFENNYFLSDDCLHVFFFCTDHIGKWPTNEKYCRQMFKMCENKLPNPMNGFINPSPSTSTFVNPVTQISTMSESTKPSTTTSSPITTTSEIKPKQSESYQID